VENTRPEKAANVTQGEGIGLSNAAERLRLLFGTRASLELDLSHSDVAIARIRIPEST
jgi:sensor histidine kinase YesM